MHLRVTAEYLALAADFVAPEFDIRHYLKGVYIEPRGEGACIVGTNGHTLCAFYDERAECDTPVILPVSATLKGACLPIFGDREDWIVEYNSESEHVSVQCGQEIVHTDHIEPIDGPFTFPDWRGVVPSTLAPFPSPATLAPCYVEQFAQVADALLLRNPGMRVYPNNDPESAAVVLVPDRRDFLGLIMPIEDEADYGVPEWAVSQAAT